MSPRFLLLSVVFVSFHCIGLAQQIKLNGQITLHNSRYQTGSLKYVESAQVSASFTPPASSDIRGFFQLNFVGLEAGTNVELQVEKNKLEVVNQRELFNVTLGRKDTVRIFMSPLGELAQAQTEFYQVSLQALFKERDRLIKQLYGSQQERDNVIAKLQTNLQIEIADAEEAERVLQEQIEVLQKQLPEMATKLARVNLDYSSAIYRQAYEAFKVGNIAVASSILDREELNSAYQSALNTIKKGKELVELGESLLAEGNLQIQEIIESYWLKANSQRLLFQEGQSVRTIERIVEILEENQEVFADRLALAKIYLGGAYVSIEEADKGISILDEGLSALDTLNLPREHLHAVDAGHTLKAQGFQAKGEYEKAKKILSAILKRNHENLNNGNEFTFEQTQILIGAMIQYLDIGIVSGIDLDGSLALLDSLSNLNFTETAENASVIKQLWEEAIKANLLLGKYEEAIQIAKKKIQLLRSYPEEFGAREGKGYRKLAEIYSFLGRNKEALALLEEELSFLLDNNPDPFTLASVYASIASCYSKQSLWEKAKANHLQGIQVLESRSLNSRGLALEYANMGFFLDRQKKLKEAREFHNKALAYLINKDDSAVAAAVYSYYANHLMNCDSLEKAKEYYFLAIENIRTKRISGSQPRFGLAELFQRQNNHREATQQFLEAIQLLNKNGGESLELAQAYYLLGSHLMRNLAQLEESQKYLFKAEAIFSKKTPKSEQLAILYNVLASNFIAQQNPTKAKEYYEKAIHLLKSYHSDSKQLGIAYLGIGPLYQIQGKSEKAKTTLMMALPFFEKDTVDQTFLGQNYQLLALALQMKGEVQKAQDYYQKAIKIFEEQNTNDLIHAGAYLMMSTISRGNQQIADAKLWLKKADAVYQKLDENLEFEAKIYFEHGMLSEVQRDPVNTQKYFLQSIEIYRKLENQALTLAVCLSRLANVYILTNKLNEAYSAATEAIEILEKTAPQHGELASLHFILGTYYLTHSELQKSLSHLSISEKIIQTFPVKPGFLAPLMEDLAQVNLLLNKLDLAEKYFISAMKLYNNSNPRIFFYLGQIQKYKKNIQGYQAYYSEALQLLKSYQTQQPNHQEIQLDLGICHYHLKDYGKSILLIDPIITKAKASNNSNFLVNLYALQLLNYAKSSQFEKANRISTELLHLDSSNTNKYTSLAQYWALVGEEKEAINALEKAIELGYGNYFKLESEECFRALQNNKKFIRLINRLKNKS